MARNKSTQAEREQLVTMRAQEALKQVTPAAGQTIIVAYGPQVLVQRGELKAAEAEEVARQVAETWSERGQTARIQFMRLPMLADERLIYTQPLDGGYLLSVVDRNDATLSRVTKLVRQLLPLLNGAGL